MVAVLGEVEHQGIVCDASGLWETAHSFCYFDADVALVLNRHQVVVVDDFLGDGGQRDPHVFIVLHYVV